MFVELLDGWQVGRYQILHVCSPNIVVSEDVALLRWTSRSWSIYFPEMLINKHLHSLIKRLDLSSVEELHLGNSDKELKELKPFQLSRCSTATDHCVGQDHLKVSNL